MIKIGIMQGRLLPPDPKKYQIFPKTTWREEFKVASELGFGSIELLFDIYDFKSIMPPSETDQDLHIQRLILRKA